MYHRLRFIRMRMRYLLFFWCSKFIMGLRPRLAAICSAFCCRMQLFKEALRVQKSLEGGVFMLRRVGIAVARFLLPGSMRSSILPSEPVLRLVAFPADTTLLELPNLVPGWLGYLSLRLLLPTAGVYGFLFICGSPCTPKFNFGFSL